MPKAAPPKAGPHARQSTLHETWAYGGKGAADNNDKVEDDDEDDHLLREALESSMRQFKLEQVGETRR